MRKVAVRRSAAGAGKIDGGRKRTGPSARVRVASRKVPSTNPRRDGSSGSFRIPTGGSKVEMGVHCRRVPCLLVDADFRRCKVATAGLVVMSVEVV